VLKKVLFNLFNFIRKRFVWHFKILYYNISLKNAPLYNKSPFLAMDLVQTEISSGNVKLDKMYSFYLKVHWHEISEDMDFQLFALDWIYMVNRPAWDWNFFDWANRVWARFVMRILSMRRTPSILYWVYAGYVLFYTEYTQKISYFILSINWEKICPINIHPPKLYWVYAGCLHFHTEYTQKTIFFILSIRRKPSELYWV